MEQVVLGLRGANLSRRPVEIGYLVRGLAEARDYELVFGEVRGSVAEIVGAKARFCRRYSTAATSRTAGRPTAAAVDPYTQHRRDVGLPSTSTPVAPAAAPAASSPGRVDYGAAGAPRAPEAAPAVSEQDSFRAQLGSFRLGRSLASAFGARWKS